MAKRTTTYYDKVEAERKRVRELNRRRTRLLVIQRYWDGDESCHSAKIIVNVLGIDKPTEHMPAAKHKKRWGS